MDQLIAGETHDPHALLGAHPADGRTTIRALRRGAGKVVVLVGDERLPMVRVHDVGVFEATVPGTVLDYRVEADGDVRDDPYRYPPTLGDLDLHLIGEGRHERLWEALGARVFDEGVAFTVWAPNARGVRVVGEFTGWGPDDGWPMRCLGSSGVREIFVPGSASGSATSTGPGRRALADKADLRVSAEVPPATPVAPLTYRWSMTTGWPGGRAQPHQSRCRSTRCTSARGGAGCPTPSSPTSWCRTCRTSGSPTWSSCR
jgi:1,4-alpha-glucan branching enzyme